MSDVHVACGLVVATGDKVELKSYEATPEGLIESYRDRFSPEIEAPLMELWDKDAVHYPQAIVV